MWTIDPPSIAHGQPCRMTHAGKRLAFDQVITAWRSNAAFVVWWQQLLAAAPFDAFRWETPGVTRSTQNQPFTFVLLHASHLRNAADASDFREHLSVNDVATFPNLGGDAMLVVPAPQPGIASYGHLASFVRSAPEAQAIAFWKAVGDAMEARLSERKVWLSTAGAGVPWLHVRLDNRPKYYGYEPFKR